MRLKFHNPDLNVNPFHHHGLSIISIKTLLWAYFHIPNDLKNEKKIPFGEEKKNVWFNLVQFQLHFYYKRFLLATKLLPLF